MDGIIVFFVVFLPIGLVAVYIQSLFPRLLATCVSIFHCGFCLITFHGIFGLRWLCYLYIFCFQFAGHFFICACDCITIAFNFLTYLQITLIHLFCKRTSDLYALVIWDSYKRATYVLGPRGHNVLPWTRLPLRRKNLDYIHLYRQICPINKPSWDPLDIPLDPLLHPWTL